MTDKLGKLPEDLAWENFKRLCQLMLEKTGMFFDDNKYSVMRNVVAERISATGSANFESYFQLINGTNGLSKTDKDQSNREFRRLTEGLAVNETSFFRNKEHFAALQHRIFPLLLRRKAEKRQLRIWSAGCSTGQEPYSLAILAIELLEQHGQRLATSENDLGGWKIEIVATDISERVLHTAQSGRYRREDMRGLLENKKRLERFFRPISSPEVMTAPLDPAHIVSPGQIPVRHNSQFAYEVIPEVRALIRFGYFNLADLVYPPDKMNNFDLVLCENVMIYFSPEVTRRVIDNIYKALDNGGFLFIGFSETLWQVSERFRLINTHETFYYQKPFPGDPPAGRHSRNEPSTGPLSPDNLDKAALGNMKSASEPPSLKNPVPSSFKKPTVREEPPSPNLKEVSRRRPPDPNLPALPVMNQTRFSYSSPSGTAPPPGKDFWKEALLEGLRSMEADEFDNASKALGEALAAAPHEVDVLCAVAQLKVKLSDYEAAASFCRKAISINMLCEQAHVLLAMIYHNTDRLTEAIHEYKQTIYINPDSVIAHLRLGDILSKQGKNSEALRHYKNALHALEKYQNDQAIEGLPVEMLKQAARDKIRRLQGPGRLR